MLKEGAAARLKSLRLFFVLLLFGVIRFTRPLLRDLAIVSFPQNTFIRK